MGVNIKAMIDKDIYSAADIAVMLDISRWAASNLIRKEIPYLKCGRLVRVRREAFENWRHQAELKSGNKRKR